MSGTAGEQQGAALVERIGTALLRLSQGMRGMLWDVAREEGLSPTQVQCLLTLISASEPPTAGALAEEFGTSAPTVSDVLNALERKGLIERRHAPADRRQVRVHLTPAGHELAARLVGWDGVLAGAVAELPEPDRRALYRSLLALLTTLERHSLVQVRACPGCAYFHTACPAGPNPHCCSLTDTPMRDEDLRIACPDFVFASPSSRS